MLSWGMELNKVKKFLKDNSYSHCSICKNYRNMNSFAHRKSELHQKNLTIKLKKISYHLSRKKKIPVAIHDEQWEGKTLKRFCHFCAVSYSEHHMEDEFVVESLGSLYHHANTQHSDAVVAFLKMNFRTEEKKKFCIDEDDLNRFLQKIPHAKERYLKKMEIINQMILNQIKQSEEARKNIVNTEIEPAITNEMSSSLSIQHSNKNEKLLSLLNKDKNSDAKIPPWLEDLPAASSSQSNLPVIGPTIETLVKHVENQKKKGLSEKRIGADFKHQLSRSSKWLPSFQGVWNQGRRKQLQIQFNRKHKV